MAAYATVAELTAFTGAAAPVDAARLLQRASDLVDTIVCAPYATDLSGMPTDVDIIAALKNATCAQVELWGEVSEANSIDGLAGTGVMLTGASGFQGKRAPDVSPRALSYLANAGLLRPGGFTAPSFTEYFWAE